MVNWFNSLSLTWKIILVILLLLLLWILWRKYGYKLTQLTQARDITVLNNENTTLTPPQQDNLKSIGKELFNDIEDTPSTGHFYQPYISALTLTDTELSFLADYYRKYLGNGESLFKAIDSQIYITSGEPAKLQARLAAIGKR